MTLKCEIVVCPICKTEGNDHPSIGCNWYRCRTCRNEWNEDAKLVDDSKGYTSAETSNG